MGLKMSCLVFLKFGSLVFNYPVDSRIHFGCLLSLRPSLFPGYLPIYAIAHADKSHLSNFFVWVGNHALVLFMLLVIWCFPEFSLLVALQCAIVRPFNRIGRIHK